MSSFDDREKAFEKKYQHDQELLFKVQNRRNKLLGLWIAELMGLPADEADAYARAVVASDFSEPGDNDVFAKVRADLDSRQVELSDHRLRKKMDELLETARQQIMTEIQD